MDNSGKKKSSFKFLLDRKSDSLMNLSLYHINSFKINDYFTILAALYNGSNTISEIFEILKNCFTKLKIDCSKYDYINIPFQINPMKNKDCPIKVISFDLDNTLWDSSKILQTAREKSFNYFTTKCPSCLSNYPTYKEFESYINEYMKNNQKYRNEWSLVRLMCFKEELQKSNQFTESEINKISENSMKIFYKYRNSVSKYLFNGVIEILKILKECKFTLITITNGNCNINEINELKSLFKYNISGESIHHFKPDKEIFNYAIDICKMNNNSIINNNEFIHIGDMFDEDINGAKSVGMHTILLNMNKCESERNIQPDIEVTSFYEILIGILFIILGNN